MDAKPATLKVIYTPRALRELDENWDWNVEHNGFDQARAYRKFLTGHIDALSANHNEGRTVTPRRDLRFISMTWPKATHSHIAVYQVDLDAATVTVAHVFHSRQNWEQKVKKEKHR
jgi:plasmid stabilization system protein ParE